jgi:hypothetical protein
MSGGKWRCRLGYGKGLTPIVTESIGLRASAFDRGFARRDTVCGKRGWVIRAFYVPPITMRL